MVAYYHTVQERTSIQCPCLMLITTPRGSPCVTPYTDPTTTPRGSPCVTHCTDPTTTPRGYPCVTHRTDPTTTPRRSPCVTHRTDPTTTPRGSPCVTPYTDPTTTPRGSPCVTHRTDPTTTPRGYPCETHSQWTVMGPLPDLRCTLCSSSMRSIIDLAFLGLDVLDHCWKWNCVIIRLSWGCGEGEGGTG